MIGKQLFHLDFDMESEEYISEGCVEEDSNSSLETNVSRLIDEEEHLDSLFHSCDTEETGLVLVSDLMACIQSVSSAHENKELQGNFDELRLLLDPNDSNPAVTLSTYRKYRNEWIKSIRERSRCPNSCCSSPNLNEDLNPYDVLSPLHRSCRRESQSFSRLPVNSSPNKSGPLISFVEDDDGRFGYNNLLQHINDISILEDGETPKAVESDVMEIQNQVFVLEDRNKKLQENNSSLQTQVHDLEDLLASMTENTEQLQQAIKGRQVMADRLEDVRRENDELKQTVLNVEEKYEKLQRCLNFKDRENTSLEIRNGQLQNQLLQTTLELESLDVNHHTAEVSLLEEREFRMNGQQKQRDQAEIIRQREEMVEDLEKMLQTANKTCESLREQNRDLEVQVSRSQEQVILIQNEMDRVLMVTKFPAMCGDENEEDMMPIKLAPSCTSTPTSDKAPSLRSEISLSILNCDELSMPLPLCVKEVEDVFRELSFPEKNHSDSAGTGKTEHNTSKDNLTGTSKVEKSLKKEKEQVLNHLDQLSKVLFPSPNLGIPRSPRSSKLKSPRKSFSRTLIDKSKYPLDRQQRIKTETNKQKQSKNILEKSLKESSHLEKSIPRKASLSKITNSGLNIKPVKKSDSPKSPEVANPSLLEAKLRQEIERLYDKLTSVTAGYHTCELRAIKLKKMIQSLQDQACDKEVTHKMIVDKIREESQQQINSSEEKVSQLQNELRSQLEVNQTIKHKLLESQKERQSLKLNCDGLQSEIKETQLSIKEEKTILMIQCTKLIEMCNHLTKERINLTEQLEQVRVTSEEEGAQLAKQFTSLTGQYAEVVDECTCVKEQCSRLQEKLTLSGQEMKFLETSRDDLKSSFTKLQEELCLANEKHKENEEQLELKIQILTKAHADLEDQYRKVEKRMEDVEEDKGKVSTELHQQKGKNADLQESLMAAHLERQIDMRELWRLVQKDVERECLTESQDSMTKASADSVRDQVAKEIEALRSQLARSQATLASLQSRTLLLTPPRDRSSNMDEPSSPLVEALALSDRLYENNRSSLGRPGRDAHSAEDILEDSGSGFEANSNLEAGDSASCPHLSGRLVTHGTQTERRNNGTGERRTPYLSPSYRHAPVNTSTGSSASAPECGSRWEGKKNVLIVETVCTPESDPGELSVQKGRSSSFKKAIERGSSADSSNLSFDAASDCHVSGGADPEVTHDFLELPPFSEPYQRQSIAACFSSHPVNNLLPPPEYIVNYAVSNRDTAATGGVPGLALQNKCLTSSVDSGFARGDSLDDDPFMSDPLTVEYKMDGGSVSPIIQQDTMLLVTAEGRQSPRRLSTLVEEASDTEADESILHANVAKVKRPPPPYARGGGGGQGAVTPSHTDQSSLPNYKAPPDYQLALQSKSRDSSPQPPPRREHSRSRSLSPSRPAEPPPYHATHNVVSPSSGEPVAPPRRSGRHQSPGKGTTSTGAPTPRQPGQSTHAHSARDVHMGDAPDADDPRQRHSDMSEGQYMDFPKGDLEEIELSEADKLVNKRLITEAQAQTFSGKQRGRKPLRHSGSSDLARSHSFDEGGGIEDGAAGQPVNWMTPPTSPPVTGQPRIHSTKEEAGPESEVRTTPPAKTDKPQPSESPKPFRITTSLQKIREENLARKKSLTKQGRMPEVSENSETESAKGNGGSFDSESASECNSQEKGQGEATLETQVCPSLPDRVLARLSLLHKKGQPLNSVDRCTDKELEDKFAGLALAFKTDKLTLEKRIELHQRSRDIAEQNIEREMQGLKEAMKAVSHFCSDSPSRDIYTKLSHHVDVLEQSTSRMSSRAEVHGAVQQELRMSKAIDVMVQHVENLKLMYEKEHNELEETRKVLQENKIGSATMDDSSLPRRISSIIGGNSTVKGGRRRASVAVGAMSRGSPLLPSTSSNLKDADVRARLQSLFNDAVAPGSSSSNSSPHLTQPSPPSSLDRASAISRLKQSSLSPLNLTAKQSVTTKEQIGRELDSCPEKVLNESADHPAESSVSDTPQPSSTKDKDTEEIAFRKGFEEGIRTKLNDELDDLKEQQRHFSDSLEHLIDETHNLEDQLEYDSVVEKLWQMWPHWNKLGSRLRLVMAGLVFSMALLSVVLTVFPLTSASEQQLRWYSWAELLSPHFELEWQESPPT